MSSNRPFRLGLEVFQSGVVLMFLSAESDRLCDPEPRKRFQLFTQLVMWTIELQKLE